MEHIFKVLNLFSIKKNNENLHFNLSIVRVKISNHIPKYVKLKKLLFVIAFGFNHF